MRKGGKPPALPLALHQPPKTTPRPQALPLPPEQALQAPAPASLLQTFESCRLPTLKPLQSPPSTPTPSTHPM